MAAKGTEFKKKRLMKTPDAEVWLVRGDKVRAKHIEFIQGGHGYVYKWIPKKEVYIDDALHLNERTDVIVHELYERELMKKGVSYDDAHKRANLVEGRLRKRDKSKVGKTLFKKLGIKPYFCTKCKDWHSRGDKEYQKHMKYDAGS